MLHIYHTRFCVYSLQNELLLARDTYVCAKGYSSKLGVKRYKQKMDPTGSIFMEGLITIHELVLAKDNDGFSPPTHIHTITGVQNNSMQMSLIIKPRYLDNVNSVSFSYI